MGLRPFGARMARMKCSKNAHSSSVIKSRAKLVSIADTSLNYATVLCCQQDLEIALLSVAPICFFFDRAGFSTRCQDRIANSRVGGAAK